jgi:hypothetical protein
VPAIVDSGAVTFVARDVPALGYRTYRLLPVERPAPDHGWRADDGLAIENDVYAALVDPDRGGTLVSLVDKRTGKELIRAGGVGNEVLEYREYANHPVFGEGPWHLTPDGRFVGSAEAAADVRVATSPIGQRIVVEREFQGSRLEQEITLWDGLPRVDFATRLHGYAGQDRLFRVRFPVSVEGGAPLSEVGNAVIGRGFGTPNVDVSEQPFTLDNPAYDWFGLGATARISLADPSTSSAEPYASIAIGVAEVIVSDDPMLDEDIRRLSIALVRTGVTSTVTRHDGHRYGALHIDSNVPDIRIALGGPSENSFVAALLEASDTAYGDELERQLRADDGRVRVWIPASPATGRSDGYPDLRGVRDIAVLVVVGSLEPLIDDLDDADIAVTQPQPLAGDLGRVEDYTVAILNRGLPGFNVEPGGDLYLSLLRSCSGWPSGVWIDPPQRSAPDGSNFQFQHWSHTFEYALTSSAGDWRSAETVRIGHEYNNALGARLLDAHPGELPARTSFIDVEPSSVVMTVLKPAGNPLAHQAGVGSVVGGPIVIRLYESSGVPTEVTVRSRWPFATAESTDVLEESSRPARISDGAIRLSIDPFEIVTLRATFESVPGPSVAPVRAAPAIEPAQPVFADYWLHNKGSAPMGNQPVSVQIRPSRLAVSGPFALPITIASERTDEAVEGSLVIVVPPGWQASPPERPYRLEPGDHIAIDVAVSPGDAAPGRYFVAARLVADPNGGTLEDVVSVDVRPGKEADGTDAMDRSRSLALAIERALATATIDATRPTFRDDRDEMPVDELLVELLDQGIAVAPGERASLRLSLRNCVASEIRGEAQVISPYDTWHFIDPWTQGFAVDAGDETIVDFVIAPPWGTPPGDWWALVKVMYFGQLHYTPSVAVRIVARSLSDAEESPALTAGIQAAV